MKKKLYAQKMLDLYIHDYLQRNNMQAIADIFAEETGQMPTGISVAEGFLMDWWSIFWDMYCSPINQSHIVIEESSSQVASVVGNNVPNVNQQLLHTTFSPLDFPYLQETISPPIVVHSTQMQNIARNPPQSSIFQRLQHDNYNAGSSLMTWQGPQHGLNMNDIQDRATRRLTTGKGIVVEPSLNFSASGSIPFLMNTPHIHELTLRPRTPAPHNEWFSMIPEGHRLSFMPETHQVPVNRFLQENVAGVALRGSTPSNELQPFQAANTVQGHYHPHWNAAYEYGYVYSQPLASIGEALHFIGSRSSSMQPNNQFFAPSEFIQQGSAAVYPAAQAPGALLPSSPYSAHEVEKNAEVNMSMDEAEFQSFVVDEAIDDVIASIDTPKASSPDHKCPE